MDNEKDWAILASGPSMSQEIADSVRGLNVIAVSNTYELAPWADILVSNDRRWWNNYPEALKFAGEKFCGLCIDPPKDVTKFASAISGSNSGLLALMIAVKKGAKRVLLFGFDMHGKHYFGDHIASLKNPDQARFQTFKKQFAGYRPQGVEIINCTPGTALKCYPLGKSEDYLPKPEPEQEPVIEKDLTGPQGIEGKQGPQGERGPRGPQGEQGPIGPMPDHQWAGTSLRFEEPDGTWGKYVDLRGPMGVQGYPGGGGGGQGMTPEQALQLQTLLDIFGGWIAVPPVASIDEVVIDDLTVNTEGSATGFYPTYPFPGTPLYAAYEWDWGDGSAHATTQDASHTYAEDGTYTIRFRAKNHIGWSDWVDQEVTVSSGGETIAALGKTSVILLQGSGSGTGTFDVSPPAGSSIFVGMGAYSDGGMPTVTDNQGNSYTLIQSAGAIDNQASVLFAAFNIASNGGTFEVTIHAGGGSFITGCAQAFSGVGQADVTGTQGDASALTGQSVSTDSTTTVADTLSISVVAPFGFGTVLANMDCTPGYTIIFTEPSVNDFKEPGGMAYRIESAAGVKTANWTWDSISGAQANSLMATFKA